MYALALYNKYIRGCVALLATLIALAVFLYGAFLLGAVAHAAGRTEAEREVQRLSAEVSRLENIYLTETKSLSLGRAAELGFVPPSGVSAVYAGASGLTVRQ